MGMKKFKTVSGYLRSTNERMLYAIPRGLDDADRVVAATKGQRDILNELLPQLELPKLPPGEWPRSGIDRLLSRDDLTERQTKALQDCQRWLKNYLLPMRSKMTATVAGPPSKSPTEFYRGYAITEVDDVFTVEGKLGKGTFASEQAAMKFVNDLLSGRTEKDAEWRSKQQRSEGGAS